jgi:C-terminal processing protease CtpA/Prc
VKQGKVFMVVSLVALLAVVAVAAGGADAMSRGLYRLVGLVGQVVALVRGSYVEEVPVERLELGALAGMVDAADPGGAWVPEEHAAAFASLAARSEVVPGSAAASAGLKAGEYIERIGADPVRARPLWLALILLERAERAGEPVGIDVIDRAADEKRQVRLANGGVSTLAPSLTDERGVPLLRIPSVGAEAVARLEGLLAGFSGPTLVVDLRGTGLGAAEAAVEAAAVIAGGEVEAPRVRRAGEAKPLRASRPLRQRTLVVCIDATTAGAAEVLAGTLKRRGATLVGSESYGDTGVRRSQAVAGGQLWLASDWFLGPDGKPVLGKGLTPDEVVRPRREGDVVLDRALELARAEALPKAA